MDKTIVALRKFRKKITTEFINSRDMEQFIEIIRGKADVIIDIRSNVFNKGLQGFMPKVFKLIMKLIQKEYYRFKELKNPFRNDFSEAEFQEAKAKYLAYLKTEEKAKDALIRLHNLINSKLSTNKIFCLICYCDTEDPLMCHRFWVFEALINYKRGILGLEQDYVYEIHIDKTLDEISEMRSKV